MSNGWLTSSMLSQALPRQTSRYLCGCAQRLKDCLGLVEPFQFGRDRHRLSGLLVPQPRGRICACAGSQIAITRWMAETCLSMVSILSTSSSTSPSNSARFFSVPLQRSRCLAPEMEPEVTGQAQSCLVVLAPGCRADRVTRAIAVRQTIDDPWLCVQALKGSPVAQHHMTGRGQFDDALPFKLGERARDRLDRQPKMIGDVCARHRKV